MSSGFNPSQAETALANKIFEKCDIQKLGIITGETAVGLFNGTKLSSSVLGEVWAIADKENNGFLTRKGVLTALRLMGHAQRREPVSEDLLSKPGLPPNIEGFSLPILQQHTGSSAGRAKSPPPLTPSVPSLTPDDKTKFMKLFYGCNPVNGVLSGEKASELFIKSKLPVDTLSQIWNLADTQNRGSLDATDFCIAMYFIQSIMAKQLSFVPTSLPPGLYDQVSGKFNTVVTHTTGSSFQPSPSATHFQTGPLQPQYTGGLQSQLTGKGPAPSIPPRSAAVPGPSTFNRFTPFSASPAPQWDITPEEKVISDKYFDGLDKEKKGYIEASIAGPFMIQSNLPENVLAHIWDLSDLSGEGRLRKDEFAVTFHLIQSKLAGKTLPEVLPPSLVPPSLRGNAQPAFTSQKPAQEIQDLLWDDSPPPSTTATIQPTQQPLQPQRTGTLNATPLQPHSTGSYHSPIQPQRTGPQLTQFMSVAPDPFASSASRDFLSDDEPSVQAPPFEDKSAEIGNLHNQLNSTNRSLNTVQSERADTEQRLAEQAIELSNLQTQLAAAKTAYETETKSLATLRERYANQNSDINKARQELITAESDVSALRLEKNEVQNALLADKEEVRDLQKKMAAAGAEIETIRAEIEKIKKDAKQQKGLLAIAKKQLAAREAEKVKVENERAEAEAELVGVIEEKDEAEAELAKEPGAAVLADVPVIGHDIIKSSSPDILATAIAQPLPDTPGGSAFGSPSLQASSVRSTNPFERLTIASPPPSQSPFMPFGSSVEPPVSTQPMGDDNSEVNLDDPFGLGKSRVEEPQPIIGFAEPSAAKDRTISPSSVIEADDLFTTPPTSVPQMHESPKGPERTSTPLDSAASKFPPISGSFFEEPYSVAPSKEVAAEEESSDDDDDGPEEATAVPKQQPLPSPPPAGVSKESSTGSSFDDVFGVSSETSASIISMPSTVTPSQTGNEPSQSSFQSSLSTETNQLSASTSDEKPTDQSNGTIAGKNAFDEAMGVITSGQTTTNATVGFNSAFDDDFDFTAAKADSNTPPFPTPLLAPAPSQSPPTINGISNPFPPAPTSTGTPFHVSVGFDNAFGVDNFSPALASEQPTVQAPDLGKEQAGPFSLSTPFGTTNTAKPETTETETKDSALHPNFDGVPVFGRDRTSKSMALFNAFGSGSIPQPSSNPSSPVQPVRFPRPSTSPPPQGTSTPPPGSNGSTHSHHEQSSNKLTPPKPRPATAEKKEPRSSRLSIRLPFSKKKKSQDSHNPPPIPARGSHLIPPQEYDLPESEDVDAVKQLTRMGFTREDAVAALEKSSYHFQRALDSLLGAG